MRLFSRPAGRRATPAAMALVALAAGTACLPAPTPAFSRLDGSFSAGALTRDERDTYGITAQPDGVTVDASVHNIGGNTRTVLWRTADGPRVDQESCATWSASTSWWRQEGAALRITTTPNGPRAITVTKNVWGGYFSAVNVHLWDPMVSPSAQWVAQFDLGAALDAATAATPGPLRMCARAVGDVVSFVVWPAEGTRPAWDRRDLGGTTRVPAEWTRAGVPGWYAGHLQPGNAVQYEDLTAGAPASR